MGSINSLFQIEDEKQKLVNIKQARKRVGELTDYLENIPGAQAKYKKLLKKDIVWDVENPVISTKESLDQILHILDGIREIVLNRENLKNDFRNIKYRNKMCCLT